MTMKTRFAAEVNFEAVGSTDTVLCLVERRAVEALRAAGFDVCSFLFTPILEPFGPEHHLAIAESSRQKAVVVT